VSARLWQRAFDELLIGVTAYLNEQTDRDDLRETARRAEAIADRADMLDQVAFIHAWYLEATPEDDPRAGEILDHLGRALAGEDVQAHIQAAMRRMRGEL